MGGDAEPHHRSSSPLKRPASSMEPDLDATMGDEVDLVPSQPPEGHESSAASTAADGDLPRAMSVDIEPTADMAGIEMRDDERVPPLAEQIKTITTLLKAYDETPAKAGDLAFLVSRKWVEKALALGGDPKQAKKVLLDDTLGPVDNSDLIDGLLTDQNGDPFVPLKPGTEFEDVRLFPQEAWDLIVRWYGIQKGQAPIIRRAVDTADKQAAERNIIFELHPLILTIHRLWSANSTIPIEQAVKAKDPRAISFVVSKAARSQEFIRDLKKVLSIPVERKIRIWTLLKDVSRTDAPEPGSSSLTPPESESEGANPWEKLLVDVATFLDLDVHRDREIFQLADQTTNTNYNGTSALAVFVTENMRLVVDEQEDTIPAAYVTTYTPRYSGKEKMINSRGSGVSLTAQNRDVSTGRSSPAPSGPITRGRSQQKKPGRRLGAVGLQNLGNTCYMNSALQCVRAVEELTKYFLMNEHQREINKANPLGFRGLVASAYGDLLHHIYADNRGSVVPRDFKAVVGKARSTFSGWGQQDSQEFLGFLLDGLQEDLSRVQVKPYIAKPDSTDDMIGNPDKIRELAEQVWDITRKRDDSVIADLFTGMYQSTLKCPTCYKISITFDPFNNLTLPLPVEDMWSRTIRFFPLHDAPVEFECELPKHSSMELLKKYISDRTGVPPERLLGAEEFKDRFFKIYEDSQDVSDEIQTNDMACFHELEAKPTNWPPKAGSIRYRSMLDVDTSPWEDARYKAMAVPVLHRRLGGARVRNTYSSSWKDDGTTPPHFIILNPQEARDEDVIRRKILEKVATFSTWHTFHNDDSSDGTDPDMVVTTASDADSSGDSKVMAQSVSGEEDLVDVTMKDSEQAGPAAAPQSNGAAGKPSMILKTFNTKRPKWASPDVYPPPLLQNLFELSFFSEDAWIPTGWHAAEGSRVFEKLSTRLPEETSPIDQDTPGSWPNGPSDEESGEDSVQAGVQTRMVEESSEEDPSPPLPKIQQRGPRNKVGGARGGKKGKGGRTYSKKNKRHQKQARAQQQQQSFQIDVPPQPTVPATADGGPLIRLGEGIVVDWDEQAWEMVYGGPSADGEFPQQGERTWSNPERLEDGALAQKRKTRMTRRSRGITLEECLDEFEKDEVLSEQDTWYCPRCKEHVRASKKFDLWKTPDILVVHLKRFSSAGYRRDKLDVRIDFPVEGLDLTERVVHKEDGKQEVYDLIAVDDHFGGLGGGHYTAWAKNFVDGQWYSYNDTSVSLQSNPEAAVTKAAYLLFYRRRSSTPLGGPRFQEIMERYEGGNEDDDSTESGEDQRLVVGSSLIGSSSAGIGAAAIHLSDRGSTRVTTRAITAREDDDPPPYNKPEGETIQTSIEDEGHEMSDGFRSGNALVSAQKPNWSFANVSSNDYNSAADALALDYPSDDAQGGSSGDERDPDDVIPGPDGDTRMEFENEPFHSYVEPKEPSGYLEPPPPDNDAQEMLSDIAQQKWERHAEKVMTVPGPLEADQVSESGAVAEIHLDDHDPKLD